MTVRAETGTNTADAGPSAEPECNRCHGVGHFNDTRYAGITHRPTPIRRKCRACHGTGKATPPPAPADEPTNGEIPAWMLGEF